MGVHFPFELLDVFMGGWCTMMVPHRCEEEFVLSKEEAEQVPEGVRYLHAALKHEHYHGDVQKLLNETVEDLELRGIGKSRIRTFCARVRASKLLLDASALPRGHENFVDPASWSAKDWRRLPRREWSEEQGQVIQAVEEGLMANDANISAKDRWLFVEGGPGTGKTEVVIHIAMAAAQRGERVLIACPVGALVDTYRARMPADPNVTIETVHASFRITRRADEQYNPPGRLRTFDLIVFDEGSQIEAEVWHHVQTACSELANAPFFLMVADFHQLQPVRGGPALRDDLAHHVQAGDLRRIELRAQQRCKDDELLAFLNHARLQQPTRRCLEDFFAGRRMPKDLDTSVGLAKEYEARTERAFTFLTVTNAAARDINRKRLERDFGNALKEIDARGVPGDTSAGGGQLVFAPGMRVRLTRNVDKQRGFVNGALGTVEHVLHKSVFVMRTARGVRILVHPVCVDGKFFMPVCYAYAMTIRRAQGSTLDAVGLYFNSKITDRGYAYVGASRVRRRGDLWLVGRVHRSAWRPVRARDDATEDNKHSSVSSSDSEFGHDDSDDSEGEDEASSSDSRGGESMKFGENGSDSDELMGDEEPDFNAAWRGQDYGGPGKDITAGLFE